MLREGENVLDYFEGPSLSDQVQQPVADVEVVIRDVRVVAGDSRKPPLELLLDTLLGVVPHTSAARVRMQNLQGMV